MYYVAKLSMAKCYCLSGFVKVVRALQRLTHTCLITSVVLCVSRMAGRFGRWLAPVAAAASAAAAPPAAPPTGVLPEVVKQPHCLFPAAYKHGYLVVKNAGPDFIWTLIGVCATPGVDRLRKNMWKIASNQVHTASCFTCSNGSHKVLQDML